MNDPNTPNLAQPHSLVRSRTPEERNSERSLIFQQKLLAKQQANDKHDAMPLAGDGVTVHGRMITSTSRGIDAAQGESISVTLCRNGVPWDYSFFGTDDGAA